MSMPTIVKAWPPGPAVEDENGLNIPRRWSVLAGSELGARNLLRGVGVYRGAPFQEDNGTIPQPFAICQRLTIMAKKPATAGGLGLYEVDAEFSTQQGLQRAVPGGPAVVTIRNSLVSAAVDIDGKGRLILTSSEEPLDPPLTSLLPSEVLHIEFYIQAKSAVDAYIPLRPYNATLNQNSFFGALKGCMLCHVFTPAPSDTGWVLCTVDFEYRRPKVLNGKTYEGWHDLFPDRGFRELIDASQKTDPSKRYKNLLDADGSRIQTPFPLNGQGKKQSPDIAPMLIDVNTYTYKNFSSIPGMRLK